MWVKATKLEKDEKDLNERYEIAVNKSFIISSIYYFFCNTSYYKLLSLNSRIKSSERFCLNEIFSQFSLSLNSRMTSSDRFCLMTKNKNSLNTGFSISFLKEKYFIF